MGLVWKLVSKKCEPVFTQYGSNTIFSEAMLVCISCCATHCLLSTLQH